jgi:hypothetical protein
MLLLFLFDVVLQLLVKPIQRLCFDLQLPQKLGSGHLTAQLRRSVDA